jgi:hypothetical protein
VAESITYIAIWAQVLPILALVFVRRPIPLALSLTAAVLALSLALDGGMVWLGSNNTNNLWIGHVWLPLATGMILWAFSFWQVSTAARKVIQIAVPVYAVVWLLVTIVAEDFNQFSRFTAPLQSLLVVAVAGYTLATRFRTTDLPLRASWFWISVGWVLLFGVGAIHDPISQLLLNSRHMDYLKASYVVKAGLGMLATVLLTLGVLCGRSRPTYGGSFSQPPAPSRF